MACVGGKVRNGGGSTLFVRFEAAGVAAEGIVWVELWLVVSRTERRAIGGGLCLSGKSESAWSRSQSSNATTPKLWFKGQAFMGVGPL